MSDLVLNIVVTMSPETGEYDEEDTSDVGLGSNGNRCLQLIEALL
jgi:hypothetical protein